MVLSYCNCLLIFFRLIIITCKVYLFVLIHTPFPLSLFLLNAFTCSMIFDISNLFRYALLVFCFNPKKHNYFRTKTNISVCLFFFSEVFFVYVSFVLFIFDISVGFF